MTNFTTQEELSPVGVLTVHLVPTGKSLEDGFCVVREQDNRIMDEAKAYVLSCIHNTGFTVDPIATFKVGHGGTITPGGADPKAVPGDRTDLYTPSTGTYTNTVGAPTLSLSGRVATFSFVIPDEDLDGENINEVGMFRASGTIFNMKTFATIPKTTGFSVVFTWTIRYL